jgi:hypothetical protein
MASDSAPRGHFVIGLMLIFIGAVLMLDRAGLVTWMGRWTLWPVILLGIGLSRFLDSPRPGPRQGLFFLAAGVWLLIAEAGWISMWDSWPILIIAFGLGVALNAGGRHLMADGTTPVPPVRRPSSPLSMIGIWIAVAVALHSPIEGSFLRRQSEAPISVLSVMGRAQHDATPASFEGADLTAVMGRSELDLTRTTIEPGGRREVQVYTVMGRTELKVPEHWQVDLSALPVMGAVEDHRRGRNANRNGGIEAEAAAAPDGTQPPTLVVRGYVLMGALVIRS